MTLSNKGPSEHDRCNLKQARSDCRGPRLDGIGKPQIGNAKEIYDGIGQLMNK
jgi:hypothetical protein